MKRAPFDGIALSGVYGRSWKRFATDLWKEMNNDNVFNGAAALAFYLTLSIFPAFIFLLTLIPYLPIPDLQGQIVGMINQALPGEAASMLINTVQETILQKREGLLSLGAVLTLWTASTGMYALMQQLNFTYDVKEGRSFLYGRLTAILLTLSFGVLTIIAFGLAVLGGQIQNLIKETFSLGGMFDFLFNVGLWTFVAVSLALAFSLVYYFAPNVKQEFRFITPGSIAGVVMITAVSLGFRYYVENFSNYNATYGGIGAVIVLMLWLNILGLVILLGSEINSQIESYSPEGKDEGSRELKQEAA